MDEQECGISRDAVAQFLSASGISTRNHFDPPIRLQHAFLPWGEKYCGRLPVTEGISQQVVCLPIFPALDDEGVDYVVECLYQAQRH